MNDQPLVQLSKARLALAECKTAMEAKQIADVAEAARVYLERTNASVDTVNHATEIRLLAERQMGAFLKAMPKSTGARGIGPNAVPEKDRINGITTLADIGISKNQSQHAQKLADIPAPEFNDRLALSKASGGKISIADITKPQRHAQTAFSMAAWQRQCRGIMANWLKAVPAKHRTEAAEFLSSLPSKLNHES